MMRWALAGVLLVFGFSASLVDSDSIAQRRALMRATGDTNALPAVWDNKADLDARFVKFGRDAAAASAAISEVASLKAQMSVVWKNRGDRHELYRAKKS